MQANPIRESGSLTLDDVRASGQPKDYEVLVDAGQIVRGLTVTWCKLKKLRSETARYPVEVFLPEGAGVGSFQAPEVQGVRCAQNPGQTALSC